MHNLVTCFKIGTIVTLVGAYEFLDVINFKKKKYITKIYGYDHGFSLNFNDEVKLITDIFSI